MNSPQQKQSRVVRRIHVSVTYIDDINQVVRTDYASHKVALKPNELPDQTVISSVDFLNQLTGRGVAA